MGYRLAEQNGESVAVPRLVFAHLARADGDTIRAALYLLGGGGTDPRTMARDLGMPSIEAAKRAMQYWPFSLILPNSLLISYLCSNSFFTRRGSLLKIFPFS